MRVPPSRAVPPQMVTHQPWQRKAPIVAQGPACSYHGHQGPQSPFSQPWGTQAKLAAGVLTSHPILTPPDLHKPPGWAPWRAS